MSAAQPDDSVPDDTASPSRPRDDARADWLVGPEEGLAAEMERSARESGTFQRPTLIRPTAPPAPPPDAARPARPPQPLHLAAPAAAPAPARPVAEDLVAPSDIVRGPGMSWEPGTSSVPQLRQEPRAHAAPQPTHDFPMDDAEERARAVTDSFAPDYEVTRPHAVVSPAVFDVRTVTVPWWMQGVHAVRSDRRVQALIALVLLSLATVALWPRGERPMSVAHIRQHAARLDGVAVKVAGRVGQVFHVGGGFAYYLLDGRDTLVVFTRVRQPRPRERVTVLGTMSTGVLDGEATLALFEANTPRSDAR